MKVFFALCLLLSSALAKPEPEADAKAWEEPHHAPYRDYGPGPIAPGFAYAHHSYHPARLIALPEPIVKCKTVYDTTYETICKNVPERICKAVPITKYRTDYRPECHAVPEKVCHPVERKVPDKECHTHPEKVCTTAYKTVYDTAYEEECKEIEHKTCHESRVVAQHRHPLPAPAPPPPPVKIVEPPHVHPIDDGYYTKKAPHGLAFTGDRLHKRAADAKRGLFGLRNPKRRARVVRKPRRDGKSYPAAPAPYHAPAPVVAPAPYHAPAPVVAPAPHCSVNVEKVCTKVPVKVARQVAVPKCHNVPKTVCHPIVRVVVETACHDEPREVCHKVPIKVPYTVPVEKCRLVPNKICKKVPHKHPREVCAHGYGYGPHAHHK